MPDIASASRTEVPHPAPIRGSVDNSSGSAAWGGADAPTPPSREQAMGREQADVAGKVPVLAASPVSATPDPRLSARCRGDACVSTER
jgi:hypothetical protein